MPRSKDEVLQCKLTQPGSSQTDVILDRAVQVPLASNGIEGHDLDQSDGFAPNRYVSDELSRK
jgi:hypothetical protein